MCPGRDLSKWANPTEFKLCYFYMIIMDKIPEEMTWNEVMELIKKRQDKKHFITNLEAWENDSETRDIQLMSRIKKLEKRIEEMERKK
jgi:hypothetical protein